MFNNLIESSSHAKEFKRRGSFLLFTTATYLALFVVTGVVSIYAYDAHLEEQNLEVVILLPPQEIVPDTPESPAQQPQHTSNGKGSKVPERVVPMLSVNHPEVPPEGISAVPNKNQPLPDTGPVKLGPADRNFGVASGPGAGTGGRQIVQPSQIVIADDPPPAPEPTPVVPKILKVSDVLNGRAEFLPKPPYPQMAKITRVQGRVTVQVLIDETGKVISAKVLDGPPLLIADSQRAAYGARFSPTRINGQPVKVSGVITYNFVLP